MQGMKAMEYEGVLELLPHVHGFQNRKGQLTLKNYILLRRWKKNSANLIRIKGSETLKQEDVPKLLPYIHRFQILESQELVQISAVPSLQTQSSGFVEDDQAIKGRNLPTLQTFDRRLNKFLHLDVLRKICRLTSFAGTERLGELFPFPRLFQSFQFERDPLLVL